MLLSLLQLKLILGVLVILLVVVVLRRLIVLLPEIHPGDALVLAGAGVALLVERVRLDVDAAAAAPELVGVLGLEAG